MTHILLQNDEYYVDGAKTG